MFRYTRGHQVLGAVILAVLLVWLLALGHTGATLPSRGP